MIISLKKLLTILFILSVFVSLIACGSGGGDDSNDSSNQTPAVDMSGTWSGTWESSVYSLSGTFTANIKQQKSTLSGSIDVPYISMIGADLKGTVEGNTIVFGDIDNQITFTGTVSEDSTTSSGTYVDCAVLFRSIK